MREEIQVVLLLPPFTRGGWGVKTLAKKNKYLCLHWDAPKFLAPYLGNDIMIELEQELAKAFQKGLS
ncbi:MAG TPA: hypothetical protein DEG17_22020 [Cyanobacteria bacterium UBA11149]|nr:hypothetical protein [Cyanobacteria bacterium UBA11367]HBE57822.1 hypothetical protein [Cyanobacteria bacterium UBA11366]HBK66089.1 hypothetical protein [Cyanobacteria bacterium UBA11166]HBR73510.1 hypothetical protein [Cyanobacteria bacterium UBA11159]HBS68954.1 hypothetical protein [Cyanobacteria bacterium UBA11153]HBW91460.1 hypothetical protein [Cyanobacteria bacterium UBA11149]HCA96822.1 hypothetical protein [Cyanobacteria bacterium UBA9226]